MPWHVRRRFPDQVNQARDSLLGTELRLHDLDPPGSWLGRQQFWDGQLDRDARASS